MIFRLSFTIENLDVKDSPRLEFVVLEIGRKRSFWKIHPLFLEPRPWNPQFEPIRKCRISHLHQALGSKHDRLFHIMVGFKYQDIEQCWHSLAGGRIRHFLLCPRLEVKYGIPYFVCASRCSKMIRSASWREESDCIILSASLAVG